MAGADSAPKTRVTVVVTVSAGTNALPPRPAAAMLALRCGPRLLGLLPLPRSAPLRLPAARACSSGGGAGDPSSSSRNPLVYLDVGADGQPLGRVVLEVRAQGRVAPDCASGMVLKSVGPGPGAVPDFLGDLAPYTWALGLGFRILRKAHQTGLFRSPLGGRREGTCEGESSRSGSRLGEAGPAGWPRGRGEVLRLREVSTQVRSSEAGVGGLRGPGCGPGAHVAALA